MAARATWKGYLKISLVNIPIKVFPATESSATISFNQLHGECQTRIQQKRWCPHCNREVPNSEIVKGYEFEKGRYVVLSEEDFDKVRTESTRVINLVQFADDSSIDPMYVDRTYYLAPDGDVAADAFAVMRDGMKGKVGVGKLALYGREYLVAVRPHGRGIVMHTLHHAAEIRSMDAVEELNSVPTKVKPDEIKLAQAGHRDRSRRRSTCRTTRTSTARDCSASSTRRSPARKLLRRRSRQPPKVVNLMEALRKSLDAVSAKKKTPAKAVAAKPVAKRKRA